MFGMKRAYSAPADAEDLRETAMSDTTYSRIWRPDVTAGARQTRSVGAGDVIANQFDRGVALTGYGLLAFSVFSAGLPAVGALALASGMAAGAPGPVAQLRLAGCGHSPHRAHPEPVREAILRFVRTLTPDTAPQHR